MTFEAVRKTALALDNVEETTSYGTPAFKTGGQLFLRMHQDGVSLVVRSSFEERGDLMAEDPETYYLTDHYLKYPWVLVSMKHVRPDALRGLLCGAWRLASASSKKPARGRRRRTWE